MGSSLAVSPLSKFEFKLSIDLCDDNRIQDQLNCGLKSTVSIALCTSCLINLVYSDCHFLFDSISFRYQAVAFIEVTAYIYQDGKVYLSLESII